jgi:hypothetical protein
MHKQQMVDSQNTTICFISSETNGWFFICIFIHFHSSWFFWLCKMQCILGSETLVMKTAVEELGRSSSSPKPLLPTPSFARPSHFNIMPGHEEVIPQDFCYARALLNRVEVAPPLLFRYALALLALANFPWLSSHVVCWKVLMLLMCRQLTCVDIKMQKVCIGTKVK